MVMEFYCLQRRRYFGKSSGAALLKDINGKTAGKSKISPEGKTVLLYIGGKKQGK
jgi:hypothetical protein